MTALNLALSAPLNVGLPLLTASRNWAPETFGVLVGCFGLGAALGSLSLLAWRPRRAALAGLSWVALGAVALASLAAVTEPSAAAAAATLLGLTSGPASAMLLGLVQSQTPANLMAKVMSLVAFSAVGLTPIGYLLFGVLAGWLGTPGAFDASAAVELVIVAFALTSRSVREATLPETRPTSGAAPVSP